MSAGEPGSSARGRGRWARPGAQGWGRRCCVGRGCSGWPNGRKVSPALRASYPARPREPPGVGRAAAGQVPAAGKPGGAHRAPRASRPFGGPSAGGREGMVPVHPPPVRPVACAACVEGMQLGSLMAALSGSVALWIFVSGSVPVVPAEASLCAGREGRVWLVAAIVHRADGPSSWKVLLDVAALRAGRALDGDGLGGVCWAVTRPLVHPETWAQRGGEGCRPATSGDAHRASVRWVSALWYERGHQDVAVITLEGSRALGTPTLLSPLLSRHVAKSGA